MKRVLCCSVTSSGSALARRLPYEHRHGRLVETVREQWASCDGLILIASTGIAVRAIGPLLADKGSDPAVVCVDDRGRHAIALSGGHQRGGNDLAREVAALLQATPVVSTATDLAGLPALDDLAGYRAEGDVAGVTRLWLDGTPPGVEVDARLAGWVLPAALEDVKGSAVSPGGSVVVVTDRTQASRPGRVLLRPATLVLGVGASTGADPAGLWALAVAVLEAAAMAPTSVGAVATIDAKSSEPAVIALAERLDVRLMSFNAADLAVAAQDRSVPNPSQVVLDAVGTPSVAEAAALLAAGPESELIAAKRLSVTGDSTLALARRACPVGHLAVVGLGPGRSSARTPEATAAVRHAEVVIGYGPYVDSAGELLTPGQDVRRYPIGQEEERCRQALRLAASGRRVALVCSGDPGVYAMASLICELAPLAGDPPVSVIPGITAALSASAVLGAPLGHDHASVSLSDLLTPWEVIARRLRAAAEGDFVVSLYNPRSQRRTTQLSSALAILADHRPPSTPAAVVSEVGRSRERITRATLSTLDAGQVDMLSIVVVGSSQTRWIGSRMVTPRGYYP